MAVFKLEIAIDEMIRPIAERKAKAVEKLAENLDLEALEILKRKVCHKKLKSLKQ